MSQQTQRDAFWDRVYDLEGERGDIVVITADMGAPALDKFRVQYAHRYVNVGIAEQNAILLASGLAKTGKHVFAYAIAPFITVRCLEQTRVNAGIMKIPFTIVGVSGGFGYIDAGPTHHSTEDIAMMRSIPNVTVHSVSDTVMATAMADRSVKMKTCNYVRLDRQPFPTLYNKDTDFSKGHIKIKDGTTLIVATGNMVHMALETAQALNNKGIDVGVVDLFEFPIQEKYLLETLKGAENIVTLEEHYYPGGMGSAVCETLMDHQVFKKVLRIALPQEKGYCYEYGARSSLQRYFGVDLNSVIKKTEAFVKGPTQARLSNEKVTAKG